jgi:hypothetical protein
MDILNHGAIARHRGSKRMLPARGQDDSRFDSIILTQALSRAESGAIEHWPAVDTAALGAPFNSIGDCRCPGATPPVPLPRRSPSTAPP